MAVPGPGPKNFVRDQTVRSPVQQKWPGTGPDRTSPTLISLDHPSISLLSILLVVLSIHLGLSLSPCPSPCLFSPSSTPCQTYCIVLSAPRIWPCVVPYISLLQRTQLTRLHHLSPTGTSVHMHIRNEGTHEQTNKHLHIHMHAHTHNPAAPYLCLISPVRPRSRWMAARKGGAPHARGKARQNDD